MSVVNLSIKEYLVSTKLALDRAFHISLELLHFPTITCHIQCNGILSTLVLMSSILSKKVSELEKDKNTPKLTGCSVWVDKLLQRISRNSRERCREILSWLQPLYQNLSRVQGSRHHVQPAKSKSTMMLLLLRLNTHESENGREIEVFGDFIRPVLSLDKNWNILTAEPTSG